MSAGRVQIEIVTANFTAKAFARAYDARRYATNPHLVPEFSHLGQ